MYSSATEVIFIGLLFKGNIKNVQETYTQMKNSMIAFIVASFLTVDITDFHSRAAKSSLQLSSQLSQILKEGLRVG